MSSDDQQQTAAAMAALLQPADSEAEEEGTNEQEAEEDVGAAVAAEAERAHQFWDAFFTLEGSPPPDADTAAASAAATQPWSAALSAPGESRTQQGAAHTLALQAAPGQSIEWIASHDELARAGVFTHPLAPLRHSDRILIVGCGSSNLGACLYDAGFHRISSMDVSSVAIARMRAAHSQLRPGMEWWVGSCCDMRAQVADAAFDVVIDKGTADTLQFRTKARRSHQLLMEMLREVHRVLTPRGVYYCITPRRRLTQLCQPDLHWSVHRLRVRVAGQERRVHKDAVIAALHAPTDAPRTTDECVKDDAFVQLCIKAPQGSEAGAGDNRPRTVREAQQLLLMVQQHQRQQGIDALAASAAAAVGGSFDAAVPPASPALPVLSRSALQYAFRNELLAHPTLTPGTHTDTLVCFDAEVTTKRKLSRKLLIYGATVRGEGEEHAVIVAPVPPSADADAAATHSDTLSPSASFVVNMRGLEMLTQFEDHVFVPTADGADVAVGSANGQQDGQSVPPSSEPADAAAAPTAVSSSALPLAVSSPALAHFTAAHSLVRKGDAVRVEGFIGLSRANCPVIFVRSVTLLAIGQERLFVLNQRATYHGLQAREATASAADAARPALAAVDAASE